MADDLLVSRRGSIFVLSVFFFSIIVYFSFRYLFFTASVSCTSPFTVLISVFCSSCSIVLIAVSQACQPLLVPCVTFLHFTSRLLAMLDFFASSLSPFASYMSLLQLQLSAPVFSHLNFNSFSAVQLVSGAFSCKSLFPACE